MLFKYPTAVEFAPLLLIGSQVALPEEMRLAYDAMMLLSIALFGRHVVREVRPKGTRTRIPGVSRRTSTSIGGR